MPLTQGSPVQITGTLQPTLDINQAAAFTGGNLDPAAFTPSNGKPYVQAAYAGPVSANLAGSQNGLTPISPSRGMPPARWHTP